MLEFKKENFYTEQLNQLKSKCKIYSIIRGILAFNFLVWIIYFITDIKLLSLLVSIFSLLILIIFIFVTNKYYTNENKLNNILKMYKIHYRRRNYDFNALIDDGYEFLDKNNYMLADLNIFGKNSLFQYINQAKTKYGRSKLANQLIKSNNKNNLYNKSIIELGNEEDTLLLESVFSNLDNNERNIDYSLLSNLSNYKVKFSKLITILICSSYLLTFISFLLGLFNVFSFIPTIIFITSNIILSMSLKCNLFNINSSLYNNFCDKYLDIIDVINDINFKDEYLKSVSDKVISSKNDLINVKKIFMKLSYRKNLIIRLIINSLIPYDYIISIYFNNKINNLNNLEPLFENCSELEMLLSFSNIVKDTNCYTIGNESNSLEASQMVHPLIKNCIPNDFKMSGGVILTGSNMSGKTTFMRTLGINQVLFNACKIVCAKSYFAPNLQIFTSLRAQDELSEGVSTFYAEILRMKLINEKIIDNKCLILIDEIFKGTNANDRISASLMVIDKLNRFNQYFIISTHDFELCEANNITNYHFNEEYIDNLIKFDYKIKDGKCNTKNAIYLLKMANIID